MHMLTSIRLFNPFDDPSDTHFCINNQNRPFVDLARALSASLSALKTKRHGRPSIMAAATGTANVNGKVAPSPSAPTMGADKGLEEKEQQPPPPRALAPFSPSLSGKRRQAPAPLPPPPGPPPQLGHEYANATDKPASASALESIV